ncbi:MAG TPA: glycosyltransferase [Tepidisphaeraceae bacterium]|jgi:glycosyltransferase involved in cell wall biosynthesis
MHYLLLTHVPAYVGQSPGMLRLSTTWLADLSAQAAALREVGFTLHVATPQHETIDAAALAAQRIIDVPLADQCFQYHPLPGYRTTPQFLAARASLRNTIAAAAAKADVVQMGPGGHPFAMGQTAWPIVRRAGKKRIFVFAEDPFPALARYAATGRNPAKRIAKTLAVRRLEQFCGRAIREADLTFSHNISIAERFAAACNDRCHTFAPSGLRDADLADETTRCARFGRLIDEPAPLRLFCNGGAQLTRGVDHLLRALAKARRLGAKIDLDLYGELTTSADLMNVVRSEKIESVVRLHGRLSEASVASAMDHADLLAAAALVPGVEQSFNLAMARGLGVATYQSGENDRHLQNSGGALVLPRGETNVLAQTLLDLSRDRKRVIALSEAAAAHAAGVTLDAIHRQRAKLAWECCQTS